MITVCIPTKDDGAMIERAINTVRPYVQEIIVIDDASVDDTVQKAQACGAIVHPLTTDLPREGFAAVRNEVMSHATQEFILLLDSDELLGEPEHLQTLTRYPNKHAWALPRRRWYKYPTQREEYEAYPDWQIRFFRRQPDHIFAGHLHIRWLGGPVHYAYRGPHIEHLQRESRTPAKIQQRTELYEKLGKIQGVAVHGGRLLELE